MPKIMGYNENRDLPTQNWEFHGGFMGISLKRIGARPLGSFSAKYWRLHQHRAWGSIMFNPCPKKTKMYKYIYIYIGHLCSSSQIHSSTWRCKIYRINDIWNHHPVPPSSSTNNSSPIQPHHQPFDPSGSSRSSWGSTNPCASCVAPSRS